MDEKDKIFNEAEDTVSDASAEESTVPAQDEDTTLEEKDGVKYETNDNWQFDASAPSLEDNIVLENGDFEIDIEEPLKAGKPVSNEATSNVSSQDEQETLPKKKANSEMVKFIPIALFVAVVIAVLTFLGVRYYTVPNGKEGDMMNPGSVVAEIDGTKVSIGMFNYYYSSIVSYYEQYASYGYYDLDTETDYALQFTTDDEGNKIRWEDFFKQECLEEIETTTAYYTAGKKAGVTLTKAQQETLDSQIQSLKDSASEAEVTLNQYIEANFGKYCTEETLRLMLEQYYITANYKGMLACNSQFTDDEINKYFEENKDDFKQITFSYLAFNFDTSDKDAEEESIEAAKSYMKKMTDEDAVKALVPEVYADYINNDTKSAMESDSKLTEKEAVAKVTESYEKNTSASITGIDSPFSEDVTKWLLSSETKIGSTNYYIDETSGYIYVILKTEQATVVEDETYSVRHILIMPESDDPNGENKEYTDEQWKAAEKKANKILEEYNKGDKTEYSFAILAEENTSDTASTSASSNDAFGGLYEGVTKGEMVPEFENWSLDSSRKYGDTGIVKSDYGYHIMFFVSSGPKYKSDIVTQLKNNRLDDIAEESNVKVHNSVVKNAVEIYKKSKTVDTETEVDG